MFDLCNADPGLEEAIDKMDFVIKKVVPLKFSLKLWYKLCHLIVPASYSVASNERVFSILELIKNYLRSNSADENGKFAAI